MGTRVTAAFTVAAGLVVAGCGGASAPTTPLPARVIAIDAASGRQRWSATLHEVALGVPTVADDAVEVLAVHMPRRCMFDLRTVELDADGGTDVARTPMRPAPTTFYSSDPNIRTIHVGDVEVTSMPVEQDDQRVDIIAGRAERTVWSHQFDGDGPASLAAAAGTVVAAWPSEVTFETDVDITVAAFDVESGDIRWRSEMTASSPWPDRRLGLGEDMYAPIPEAWPERVYAVAPGAPAHGVVDVAVVEDRVIVPSTDDELVVLDLADGRPTGTVEHATTPFAAAGGVLVARRGTALIAMDRTGNELWSFPLPAWSPLVRLNGSETAVYASVSGRYGGGPCPRD